MNKLFDLLATLFNVIELLPLIYNDIILLTIIYLIYYFTIFN